MFSPRVLQIKRKERKLSQFLRASLKRQRNGNSTKIAIVTINARDSSESITLEFWANFSSRRRLTGTEQKCENLMLKQIFMKIKRAAKAFTSHARRERKANEKSLISRKASAYHDVKTFLKNTLSLCRLVEACLKRRESMFYNYL